MASERVHELNELNFEEMVLRAQGPVLVDVTAAWCAPCRALSPIVHRIADEMHGRVRVGTLDADACPNLASELAVRGLPTLIVFVRGEEVARRLGLANEAAIRKLLGVSLVAAEPCMQR
jgi:thioredoxin 1